MADIKLFVCCHLPTEVPKHPLLVPLQAGTALADRRYEGFLHDNEGENISQMNRFYCELTAQYWAWKNAEADYYGFFHYRRYLCPDLSANTPYRVCKASHQEKLVEHAYDRFAELIEQYDLIAPIGEDMHVSVREHYASAPHHFAKDLLLVERIVAERHPEMVKSMNAYLSGAVNYFGNMYIMRKAVFMDYCAWLFPILAEYDRRTDLSGYAMRDRRVDGYLAERLFGIYYTHMRQKLRTLELPRVLFYDRRGYTKQWLLNTALPPGTRRRAFVKAVRREIGTIPAYNIEPGLGEGLLSMSKARLKKELSSLNT